MNPSKSVLIIGHNGLIGHVFILVLIKIICSDIIEEK